VLLLVFVSFAAADNSTDALEATNGTVLVNVTSNSSEPLFPYEPNGACVRCEHLCA
jgi:hypothetical protein